MIIGNIYYWKLQFLNNVIIDKPKALVTLVDYDYPV